MNSSYAELFRGGNGNNVKATRVLHVAAIDLAVKNLLLPLMKGLRDEGYDVECAAADLGNGSARAIREEGFVFNDLDMERTLSLSNLIGGFRSILALLSRKKFDIVHFHTPLASFVGRFAARMSGTPNIFCTAHGFYFHDRMPWQKRMFFELAEIAAGHGATDFLFCQSTEDADWALARRFLSPSRILHIGNGVDVRRFRPDISLSSTVRKELGLEPEATVITFMGRLVLEKGILDLGKAFTGIAGNCPGAVLLVAGDSKTAADRDSSTSGKLRQMITMNSMENRIRLIGFRNDPERILAASDIFVLPSYREGLPRSICEAMACGLPVIASNIRGCREEVTDGINGILFEPGSIKALERAMMTLVNDRGARMTMGKNALKTARAELDEDLVIKRQISVYRKIQGNCSRPMPGNIGLEQKNRPSTMKTRSETVVGREGVEPPTHGFSIRCSTD